MLVHILIWGERSLSLYTNVIKPVKIGKDKNILVVSFLLGKSPASVY